MTDLVAFLRARLDEDEQAAHEASTEGAHWSQQALQVGRRHPVHYVGASPDAHVVRSDAEVARADHAQEARHIARHDPARVLREVEAKRATLADYENAVQSRDRYTPNTDSYRNYDNRAYALYRVLVRDAAVHADHPDYREDWPS